MPPTFKSERVAILPLRAGSATGRRGIWSFVPSPLYVPALILARHRRAPYVCVIGVDPAGLGKAETVAGWVGAPLAYFSLELMFDKELKGKADRDLKARERASSQRAAFVVVLGSDRAEALGRENGIPDSRMVVVPNSPLGKASRSTSAYLRVRYGLGPESKIVLNSGSLDTWAGAHELIWSTRDWPEHWTLVCHTRYAQSYLDSQYFKALKCMAKTGRVVFSTDPVDRKTYPEIVRSADVGVAFYVPQDSDPAVGDNLRLMGLSSGKFAYYMQAGIPVLVNDVASLNRLVTTYRCGEVAVDPGRTVDALRAIFDNYSLCSAGALRCFDAEWDFARAFEKVSRAIATL